MFLSPPSETGRNWQVSAELDWSRLVDDVKRLRCIKVTPGHEYRIESPDILIVIPLALYRRIALRY